MSTKIMPKKTTYAGLFMVTLATDGVGQVIPIPLSEPRPKY